MFATIDKRKEKIKKLEKNIDEIQIGIKDMYEHYKNQKHNMNTCETISILYKITNYWETYVELNNKLAARM